MVCVIAYQVSHDEYPKHALSLPKHLLSFYFFSKMHLGTSLSIFVTALLLAFFVSLYAEKLYARQAFYS